MTYMFLNGGGMRGGPVHDHIAGAPLVRECATAPRYRFFAVNEEFPGLWPDEDGGASIQGELYELPLEMLRDHLLPVEPAELELGIIELDNGEPSLAMILRREVYESGKVTDITSFGGWRAYRAANPVGVPG